MWVASSKNQSRARTHVFEISVHFVYRVEWKKSGFTCCWRILLTWLESPFPYHAPTDSTSLSLSLSPCMYRLGLYLDWTFVKRLLGNLTKAIVNERVCVYVCLGVYWCLWLCHWIFCSLVCLVYFLFESDRLCFVVEGQMNFTPSTLHEMWTEEGIKAHEMKTRFEEILRAKGVRPYNAHVYMSYLHTDW